MGILYFIQYESGIYFKTVTYIILRENADEDEDDDDGDDDIHSVFFI
jgi:hypothetical protein